ncbi:MAG: TlyA family RNA methyltransferase [Candidatus Saccharimonadales bacterium]
MANSKLRLDQALVAKGLVTTRSQAESYIKLGQVKVAGRVVAKPGFFVDEKASLELVASEQYVSRAALKLASVATALDLDFSGKVVLDVGSSTGGFTDYALRRAARKVIDIEVGTNQLASSLRGNPKIELYEQTDVRDVRELSEVPDIVVIDVSFISLREILPSIARLSCQKTQIVAMVKPQFEAASSNFKHKGVIKNDHLRRDIFKDFESWAKQYFVTLAKADLRVLGAKGNQERFYKLVVGK